MNIFDYKVHQNGEEFTALLEHKNIKIVRIISSDKLEPKVYIQEEDEWVAVLEGEATILIDNEPKILNKGDTLFIPSQTPHEIINVTNGTLWLAIHIY
ncbi:MAG: cupin domain-containing protein [Campylobacterales bacterium]|nr:cupin domain-containing protein [Campylobacterales bacterium]